MSEYLLITGPSVHYPEKKEKNAGKAVFTIVETTSEEGSGQGVNFATYYHHTQQTHLTIYPLNNLPSHFRFYVPCYRKVEPGMAGLVIMSHCSHYGEPNLNGQSD